MLARQRGLLIDWEKVSRAEPSPGNDRKQKTMKEHTRKHGKKPIDKRK